MEDRNSYGALFEYSLINDKSDREHSKWVPGYTITECWNNFVRSTDMQQVKDACITKTIGL